MALAGSNEASDGSGIRPLVKTATAGNSGLWLFLAILVIAGFMLFSALESRRLDSTAPATSFDSSFAGRIASPEPLALPNSLFIDEAPAPVEPVPIAPQPRPVERVVTRIVDVPAPVAPVVTPPSLPQPAIMYDSTIQPRTLESLASGDEERVTATRLKNPSLTVPKGTVIPAVLESAMDSTRAGAIRALVTRDIMSFDGTRVLIPRGSRIYGEYAADLNYGQNRALVVWNRLLRPDGVMINLASPAADPLGRAGLRGKVNTHFFSRFGAAILQTTLDVGASMATRRVAGDGVVVALPGSTQNVGGRGGSIGSVVTEGMTQVVPTLTVKQGTAVSVFVAKDLDFSTVEE